MGEQRFKDNALTKIVAFDFDNTLTDSDIFPAIGKPRKYARQVVNLLYELGVTVIVWTCRDIDLVSDMADDISPMRDWLGYHGFKYHAVNRCIEYAPFHYEARKIYAHMYVDDKAFGWDGDDEEIMIKVFVEFMSKHSTWSPYDIAHAANMIRRGEEFDATCWGRI